MSCSSKNSPLPALHKAGPGRACKGAPAPEPDGGVKGRARGGRPSRPGFAGRPGRFLALALGLAVTALCGGCGYGLSSDLPTVLGNGSATLRLTGVEQPTLYPWVNFTVRSAMRDEITARNLAAWVEGGSSDYTMHIRVNSFTMRGAVSGRADETLLYTGSVSITATIYGGADKAAVWRGSASYSANFDNETEEAAARRLFVQAVRRLAGKMRNTF